MIHNEVWLLAGKYFQENNLVEMRNLLVSELDAMKMPLTGGQRALDSFFEDTARSGNIPMAELFVQFGADIHSLNTWKSGVISTASSNGHLPMVQWLVSIGAKINQSIYGKPGCSALNGAAHMNHLEIARYLVEQGAVVNFVNSGGYSPLDFALMYHHPEMEDYLRSVGAKRGSELPQDHLPQPEPEPRYSSVREHLAAHFPGVEEFPLREIVPGNPPLTILRVPDWYGGYVGLVTEGMSEYAMPVPEGAEGVRRAELMLLLPPDWPLTEASMREHRYRWPIDWMRRIARMPFQTDTYLPRASIIANGEPPMPLADNTELTCLLISVDTTEEKARWLRSDGELVELVTLTPLYTVERDYERINGMSRLLYEIDQRGTHGMVRNARPPMTLGE